MINLSFHGRMTRQNFLALTVILDLIGVVFLVPAEIGVLSLISDYGAGDSAKEISESISAFQLPTYLGWTLLVFGILGLLWVALGLIWISVKRLHDLGMPGYIVLFFPVMQAVMHGTVTSAFPLLGPAYLVWTLVLTIAPGTRGPNAFGPDPAAEREPGRPAATATRPPELL